LIGSLLRSYSDQMHTKLVLYNMLVKCCATRQRKTSIAIFERASFETTSLH